MSHGRKEVWNQYWQLPPIKPISLGDTGISGTPVFLESSLCANNLMVLVHFTHLSNIFFCGQFQDGILDICLSMLDMGLKYHKDSTAGMSQLSDPIHIGRVLSAMVRKDLQFSLLTQIQ